MENAFKIIGLGNSCAWMKMANEKLVYLILSIAPAAQPGDAHKPLKMTSISFSELWSALCHMPQPINIPQVI